MTADIEHARVPPTIEAVLAARVDALGAEERQVLEPASVIGRDFSKTAVDTLIETPVETDAVLGALIRRQLVTRSRDPDLLADHRFRSLLLRDVVYDGLLKRTRSTLHLRFADWLETFSSATGRRMEMDEILGYHLEQAFHLRSGLGAVDAEADALGRRAADRLAPAGLRAFGRGDMPAAANLLGRAARALPDDDPTRPRLLARAAEARMETGAFPDSVALYDEAEANAIRSDDPVAAGIAELGRAPAALSHRRRRHRRGRAAARRAADAGLRVREGPPRPRGLPPAPVQRRADARAVARRRRRGRVDDRRGAPGEGPAHGAARPPGARRRRRCTAPRPSPRRSSDARRS